jgi:hypothetical protein
MILINPMTSRQKKQWPVWHILSKARVCCRALAGWDCGFESLPGSRLWVFCVARYRSLRRADHSSRGVLSHVVCHCVRYRNLKNEKALARVGLLRPGCGGGVYKIMTHFLTVHVAGFIGFKQLIVSRGWRSTIKICSGENFNFVILYVCQKWGLK